VTLIEVIVAFVVLMIALIPLSYLFTTSIVQAGQAKNQQTALSIAERWTEILANVTPPVDANHAVITDTSSSPAGPAPSSSAGTVASASNNKALNAIASITVTSSASFQSAQTANQTVQINTGTTTSPVLDTVSYSAVSQSGNTVVFTCTSNPCSTSSDSLSTGDAVTQSTIVTPSETRGGTVYGLAASYSWATAQNSGSASKPNLCASGTPQLLKLRVTVTWGPNGDVNNVQDSTMIDYPPAGVQTLGFIAVQVSGDTTASDTQSPSEPWSTRVQAVNVQITGAEPTFTIHPDSYGCAFAQVQPGAYTVTLNPAINGTPVGTTYASPSFVANAAGTAGSNHIVALPTQEGNSTALCGTTNGGPVTVAVGAVNRLAISTLCFPGYEQGAGVNLTYPSSSTVEDGVACPGSGQLTCLSTGENGSGAVATALSGSTWSSAALPTTPSVTRVANVACATTTACIGVGYGSSGAVLLHATTGASPTFTADTIPTSANLATSGASLTQVACPSALVCVVAGTTGSGAGVILTGVIGATSDTWTTETVPSNLTSVSNLTCPTNATGCAATVTTSPSNAPEVISGPLVAGTWTAWTTPASGATSFTVTALAKLACTTAVPTTCMADGTGKVNGGASGPVVLSGATSALGLAATTPWAADTVAAPALTSVGQIVCPTTTKCLIAGTSATGALFVYGAVTGSGLKSEALTSATSVTQVVCATSSLCTAIGASSTAPLIFSGNINATVTTADTWTSDTVPSGSGITTLTELVCPSSSSCLAMATGLNATVPFGALVDTTNNSATGATWSIAPLPSTDNVLYFDDIDCTSGATGTCAAVGATPTGAVILNSTGGPGGSWSDNTPGGTAPTASAGYVTTGVPIQVNSSGLKPSTFATVVTAGASPNITSGPGLLLYPFSSGYALGAGDCGSSEMGGVSATTVATQPGGSATATVPLGLLSVSVAHTATGLPYSGATLSLKTSLSGCAVDTYGLQPAGADGLSRTEVPFGTYGLYLNGSAAPFATVVVAGNTATVGSTVYTLPTPVAASA
jgi:Tfp pilus assembly protein PilV